MACAAAQAEVVATDDPINIVFVSSEVAPWAKTGGLGDVAGSLPPAFAARGEYGASVLGTPGTHHN